MRLKLRKLLKCSNLRSCFERRFNMILRDCGFFKLLSLLQNRVIIDSSYVADSLTFGDSLHFYYAGYVFNTSPSGLFATNVEQIANSAGLLLTDQDFAVEKVLFTEGCYIPGLVNGLYGVREGEHSLILFSAEHGFYNETVYNIPKLSALAYEVWIEKVIKNE